MKKKYTKIQNENEAGEKSHGLEIFRQYADEIDAICRRRLPDGVIMKGVLSGRESEIRQNAMLMLMSGFLIGNPRLVAARKAKRPEAVAFEIERSTAIALSKCKQRLASKLADAGSAYVQISERNGGKCKHPYEREVHEWMPDTKARMVMKGLDIAVEEKQLSPDNAELVTMIVKDGRTVAEVAAHFQVSSNAIYQRIRRVGKRMPEFLSRLDL